MKFIDKQIWNIFFQRLELNTASFIIIFIKPLKKQRGRYRILQTDTFSKNNLWFTTAFQYQMVKTLYRASLLRVKQSLSNELHWQSDFKYASLDKKIERNRTR